MKRECKTACLVLGTGIGVYLSFRYVLPLFVPFFFAYFIVKMILPIVGFLQDKFKIPKMMGSILTMMTLLGTLGFSFVCLSKTLISQAALLLKNTPVYGKIFVDKMDTLCQGCDKFFGLLDGSARKLMDDNMGNILDKVKGYMMPVMTQKTVLILIKMAGFVGILFVIFISVFMILKDLDSIQEAYEKSQFYKEIHPVASKLADTGYAYLKTQGIIITIVGSMCTVALILINNKYPVLIGIGIAVFDAIPLFGSGSILVPWAIYSLIERDIFSAAVLLTLYLLCQLTRQILEPKLLGDRIGIKPIFTIMSIYGGIRLFGISGFILGPIALVIILTVVQTKG